ncbi:MAG: ribosome maturation factor RimM [Betaproteobacteria bacterium]
MTQPSPEHPGPEKLVVMGRIRAPYGLKGWVNVQPFTQEIDGLLGYQIWWVGGDGHWQQHRISESAVHGSMVVARLDGFSDRDTAAGLRGKDVAVPRDAMPENKDGEYYWRDLLGLEVTTLNTVKLGVVTKILETGANTVLVVQGEKELLVPFIEGVIANVDLKARKVVVDWEPN